LCKRSLYKRDFYSSEIVAGQQCSRRANVSLTSNSYLGYLHFWT